MQLPSLHPSLLPRPTSHAGSGSDSDGAGTPRPAVGAPLRKTSFLPTTPADELQVSGLTLSLNMVIARTPGDVAHGRSANELQVLKLRVSSHDGTLPAQPRTLPGKRITM